MAGFAVTRLHAVFGSENSWTRPRAEISDGADKNPKQIMLEVLGTPGARATINYLDLDALPQTVKGASLPWAVLLSTTDPSALADVRAQGDADFISCRITVNGIVKVQKSTDNLNGYISCLDKTA